MLSPENLSLNPDFIDMLNEFFDAKVDFMVVGAYALSFHGTFEQLETSTSGSELLMKMRKESGKR